jgi:hypothetical protein
VEGRGVERHQVDGPGHVEQALLDVAAEHFAEDLLALALHGRGEERRHRDGGHRQRPRHQRAERRARPAGGHAEQGSQGALADQQLGGEAEPAGRLQGGGDQQVATAGRPEQAQPLDGQPG